ncbi:MAG: type IV pilin [Halorientalis sp.]
MQIKKLLQEDDAVSPVIGVILMVAITVILAAVIASFVLGLGGNTTATPTASFSWNYDGTADDSSTDNDGIITVTHDGGDTIVASQLSFKGSGFDSSVGGSVSPGVTASGDKWPNAQASGSKSDKSAVVAGDTVTIGAKNDYDMSLVWTTAEGGKSATLSSSKGPKA